MFSDNDEFKSDSNNQRKFGKFINMWKLNNTFLSNQWVKEEITKEIRKHFRINENENTTYQTFQKSANIVFRKNFIVMNAYIKKRSQINSLNFHLKSLEKEKQAKSNTNKKKEVIMITVEISEIENWKMTEKTKSWFFEKKN